jgi:hypothetical protein
MKPVIYLIALLSLVGLTPVAWAGAVEDVVAIGQQQTTAFDKGDLDSYMVAFADNAALTPALPPFRVEGGDQGTFRHLVRSLFNTPRRRTTGLHTGVCKRQCCCVRWVSHPYFDRQRRNRERAPPPHQHDMDQDGQRMADRGSAQFANAHSVETGRYTKFGS